MLEQCSPATISRAVTFTGPVTSSVQSDTISVVHSTKSVNSETTSVESRVTSIPTDSTSIQGCGTSIQSDRPSVRGCLRTSVQNKSDSVKENTSKLILKKTPHDNSPDSVLKTQVFVGENNNNTVDRGQIVKKVVFKIGSQLLGAADFISESEEEKRLVMDFSEEEH